MPIVRHAKEMRFILRLLRLVRNVDVASDYHGLDLCCSEEPMDGFYLLKDADTWWHELEFKGRQRHHAQGLRFLGCHILKLFALPPSEKMSLYTLVPNGCDHESNRPLEVSTPVMFSYLVNNLRMSSSKV